MVILNIVAKVNRNVKNLVEEIFLNLRFNNGKFIKSNIKNDIKNIFYII
jgi:hypothetical protein